MAVSSYGNNEESSGVVNKEKYRYRHKGQECNISR